MTGRSKLLLVIVHTDALVSIVERKFRNTLSEKVSSRDSVEVGTTTQNFLLPIKHYVHTITGDNGKEFVCHETFSENLEATFYFARPYRSWERRLNENTNGLIRQYVPKGSDLTPLTDEDMKSIMQRLHGRQRECLGYKTPEEVFFKSCSFSSSHVMMKRAQENRKKRTCAFALTN